MKTDAVEAQVADLTGAISIPDVPRLWGALSREGHILVAREGGAWYAPRGIEAARAIRAIESHSIYFEAQTGLIRDQPAHNNFHQYRLATTDRPVVEAAVAKATLGCGGLQYEDGFLRSLDTMADKHRRQLLRTF